MSCFGDCLELGPPPDMILSMPPPPLSSFLLPKNALVAASKPNGNSNHSLLCSAAFICEPSLKAIEQSGMEFIELPGNGMDDTWVLVLISSCVGVLLLGALLAMVLIKCRDSFGYSYHDSNLKQPPLHALGTEPVVASKAAVFMPGGTILYPTGHVHHHSTHPHQHGGQPVYGPDNRTLWAALTPHGTQHFITESYGGNPEDHYEVIDYGRKHEQYIPASAHGTIVKSKNSFENSGFVDYDYEDPTPLMESYAHFDDMDSGYQEPQEVLGSLGRPALSTAHRHNNPTISSPVPIEHPNLAPLNLYPTVQSHRSSTGLAIGQTGTLSSSSTIGRKSSTTGAGTLSRRISDIKN
ncbi:AGAP008385-PA-like protein [Anopheles sinensis]|uniref:AGAP008385-PA-like protein n=1 Tax=Anopheles sinensis TaxID=74873 RepID=A0A084WH69_ANOSI|nr:AGAP008385-PA-like protein [Anopheles sinensis]